MLPRPSNWLVSAVPGHKLSTGIIVRLPAGICDAALNCRRYSHMSIACVRRARAWGQVSEAPLQRGADAAHALGIVERMGAQKQCQCAALLLEFYKSRCSFGAKRLRAE